MRRNIPCAYLAFVLLESRPLRVRRVTLQSNSTCIAAAASWWEVSSRVLIPSHAGCYASTT
jgi:hypothetical protein